MAATARDKKKPSGKNGNKCRLMIRVSWGAKERLRQYAVQVSSERGRTVSMTKVLEDLLSELPLKARDG